MLIIGSSWRYYVWQKRRNRALSLRLLVQNLYIILQFYFVAKCFGQCLCLNIYWIIVEMSLALLQKTRNRAQCQFLKYQLFFLLKIHFPISPSMVYFLYYISAEIILSCTLFVTWLVPIPPFPYVCYGP